MARMWKVPAVVLAVVLAGQQRPSRPPDIYFAGTPQRIVNAMLELAKVTAGEVVYDLGSGDGRIVIVAAQKYGARGVGIEIDPALVARSRALAAEGGVADRVEFIEADMFATDISRADVVTLWLSPSINRELEPKFRRELKPGARIVSHQFRMGNWTPDEQVTVAGEELFLWRIPPR